MKKITVKNSGLIKLQFFNDTVDGHLYIGEAMKHVPFKIKRFYVINKLSDHTSIRGKHAHKELEQYIFSINGSFTLHLDDGTKKQRLTMNHPGYGVRLGPMLWHTMSKFSNDCVILVVASDYYDENDYIRNYEDFIQQVKPTKH